MKALAVFNGLCFALNFYLYFWSGELLSLGGAMVSLIATGVCWRAAAND
jgi:hypothetical protein